MQDGIDISVDTSTPGSLALTVQQISAGAATTLETAQIALPAASAAATASAFASDAWLASFPKDDCGFTIFSTPAPTNIAFVGTLSGDFASFKPAQAYVAAAMAKNGGGGAVYFRRGQTYAANTIDDNIQLNGPSASEPFIVGCTSDLENARPILQKSFGVGGSEYGNTFTQNVVVFGLDFYDPLGDPSVTPSTSGSQYEAALRMVESNPGGKNVWVEDVRVRFMQGGLEFQGASAAFQTVIVRRCIVDHNYGQRWGIYTYFVQDFLLEESFTDNNGWNDTVCPKTETAHNVYLQEWPLSDTSDPQTRVRGLLTSRASATGIEQRSGGLNDGCCYVGNPIAMNIGPMPSSSNVVSNAVFMGAGFDLSIGAANPRGWGAQSVQCPSVTFQDLIFTDKSDTTNAGTPLAIQCSSTGDYPAVATAATIVNCVADVSWLVYSADEKDDGEPISVTTPPNPASIVYQSCDLPNMPPGTTGVIPTPTYLARTRTLALYAPALGISGVVDGPSFLAAAALNRRGNWNPSLTAAGLNTYIQQGFLTGE